MGHRANLIITDGRHVELFYCHWCGIALARYLFWGPAHAEAFIRLQEPFTDDLWLDVNWAEGGAVLDTHNKKLLLFSYEDLREQVPLRRLYMRLLAEVWQGWDVEWAYFGVSDLVDYIGAPRRLVEREITVDSTYAPSTPLQIWDEEMQWPLRCVGSFVFQGKVAFYLFPNEADGYLVCGPALVEPCLDHEGHTELVVANLYHSFPESGFHIDVDRKQVHYWMAAPERAMIAALPAAWPGWQVTFHHDMYEIHYNLAGPALQLNVHDDEELAQLVTEYLFADQVNLAGSGFFESLGRAYDDESGVNPLALRDERLPLDEAHKREILARAFRRLQNDDSDSEHDALPAA